MKRSMLLFLIGLALLLLPTTTTPALSIGFFPKSGTDTLDPWARAYGNGTANSVQQTLDGGFIVAGSTSSLVPCGPFSCSDAWVLRLDASGNVLWEKAYGGTGITGFVANSVKETSDGGYIIAGSTGILPGTGDAWVLRLDASGNVIWQKTYGGIQGEEAFSVQQTDDGGFVVAGYTESFGAGVCFGVACTDAWVLRLDSSGNVVWQNRYPGVSLEDVRSIQQTSDGGFIVAGSIVSRITSLGVGDWDAWVLRLDAAGGMVWEKAYGLNDTDKAPLMDKASSIQQTSDGGFIVAGFALSFGTGDDFWVLKLDASGNIVWQNIYGGAGADDASSIQQTSDGGFIVAGTTQYSFANDPDDFWVLKLDASGNIVWQNIYGGAAVDVLFSIQQTNDGGFVLGGFTESFGSGGRSAWVLRLDSAGKIGSHCKPIGSTKATVTSTAAKITTANIIGINTSASGTTTSAIVRVTSTAISVQCQSSATVFPDVAVSAVAVSRNFAYSGVFANPMTVNVTASNPGTVQETFFVSAKANITLIGNQTVTLAPGASHVVAFSWNTTSLVMGKYILRANASPVTGETNLFNNNLTWAGTFTVRFSGDLDGDCKVTILDISSIAFSFDSTSASANWNPNADLNNDGRVNILDVAIIAVNFDKSCA